MFPISNLSLAILVCNTLESNNDYIKGRIDTESVKSFESKSSSFS